MKHLGSPSGGAQCSGERAGLQLLAELVLTALEGCAEAPRPWEVGLSLRWYLGFPFLPRPPCLPHFLPLHPALAGPELGVRTLGLLCGIQAGNQTCLIMWGSQGPGSLKGGQCGLPEPASPGSVEDPPWGSLFFERRKEAEKRRACYWRKHWGSQEIQREVGWVSVW